MKIKNISNADFFFLGITFGLVVFDVLSGNGFWSIPVWVAISFLKLFLKEFLRRRRIRK